MKFFRLLMVSVVSIYFISCGTQKKAISYYLDNVKDTSFAAGIQTPELKIQKNDLLSIQVYSESTKPEIDALYNLPSGGGGGQSSSSGGFLVDAVGNIEYPRLGTIHAEGLTKQQLAEVIKEKLTKPVELLRNPSVIIRLMNYQVTVLGQVGREGVQNIPGERITILQAIGLAGGITDYGKKDRIKIIRETDGKREIGYVTLTSDSLFTSPYYNLVQNDVLIVAPTGKKEQEQEQAKTTQKISFALTLLTVAITLYNIFK